MNAEGCSAVESVSPGSLCEMGPPHETPTDSVDSAMAQELTARFDEMDRQEEANPRAAASPAEFDGHGDKDSVASEKTTPNNAVGADAIDQPDAGGPVTGRATSPVTLPEECKPKRGARTTTVVIGAANTSDDAESAAGDNDDLGDESGQPGSDASPADDSSGNTSGEADPAAADEDQAVPQLLKQALESLLDETMGDLIALEDFDRTVDDRAFENEWLGKHTPISLAVFGAEVAKTRKCTFHVDETGKLLSDPVTYRLTPKNHARITLCVHRDLSEDQKKDFILRLQARDRSRTDLESRELKRKVILTGLRLGVDYETIAKMAGVCPNTARNVEKRAAADPNSKLANTKKDRRYTWSTPENVAEAHRLRAEGKNNSQIAKALGTTPATIGKLFKERGPQANAKNAEDPKTSSETVPAQSPPTPSQVDTTRVPDDGIPKVVRLHLEHRGLRGVLAAKEYAELLKPQQDDAREKIEGLAKHKDELLRSFLYHRAAAAFAEAELQKQLLAAAKEGAA